MILSKDHSVKYWLWINCENNSVILRLNHHTYTETQIIYKYFELNYEQILTNFGVFQILELEVNTFVTEYLC